MAIISLIGQERRVARKKVSERRTSRSISAKFHVCLLSIRSLTFELTALWANLSYSGPLCVTLGHSKLQCYLFCIVTIWHNKEYGKTLGNKMQGIVRLVSSLLMTRLAIGLKLSRILVYFLTFIPKPSWYITLIYFSTNNLLKISSSC